MLPARYDDDDEYVFNSIIVLSLPRLFDISVYSSGLLLLYIHTYVKGFLLLCFLKFVVLLILFFLLIRILYLLVLQDIASDGGLRVILLGSLVIFLLVTMVQILRVRV